MDGILTAINEFFRGILFAFAKAFLYIFDIVWECIRRIVTLDIPGYLYNWYWLIIILIVLFLIFRIFKIYLKTMLDEDYRARINISQVLIKLILASFAMGFTPIAFSFVSEMTADFIDHIGYFIPTTSTQVDNLQPSTVLLEAGRINVSNINGDLGPEINVTDHFDVNAKDENGNYLYFATYTSLFLLIIESIAGCFIFVLIAIMIGQRLFSIAYKYLLAPYPISGLIDHEDKSFATWMKMLLGDFMMNFAQVYGVYLTIILCNNASIQRMMGNDTIGISAKILFFLAGLVGVLNIPTIISTILGGHGAGALQSLQETKTILTMSKSLTAGTVGATAGVAIGGLGGAIGGIASAYNDPSRNSKFGYAMSGVAGTVRGGFQAAKTTFSGGSIGGGVVAGAKIFKSGASILKSNSGKGRTSSQGKYDFINQAVEGGKVDRSSPAFNEPPSEKQLYVASQLGIDNPESYSKGELSMMIQEHGGDQSYWDGTEQGESFKLNGKSQEQSLDVDESVYTSRTTDHVNNMTGEKVYGDTLRTRLQKSSTKLNGKPLKK